MICPTRRYMTSLIYTSRSRRLRSICIPSINKFNTITIFTILTISTSKTYKIRPCR
nr:MAG TPA: hypothetical protein [Caudoviricetes sp.]